MPWDGRQHGEDFVSELLTQDTTNQFPEFYGLSRRKHCMQMEGLQEAFAQRLAQGTG